MPPGIWIESVSPASVTCSDARLLIPCPIVSLKGRASFTRLTTTIESEIKMLLLSIYLELAHAQNFGPVLYHSFPLLHHLQVTSLL